MDPAHDSVFKFLLNSLGFQIVEVPGDGNCMFRSIADQMEGNQDQHSKYRDLICNYMMDNQELFKGFIFEEESVAAHVQKMRRNGVWGDHMELQATAFAFNTVIFIHEYPLKCTLIENSEHDNQHFIHLSYHHNNHYNSVRSTHSTPTEPAIWETNIKKFERTIGIEYAPSIGQLLGKWNDLDDTLKEILSAKADDGGALQDIGIMRSTLEACQQYASLQMELEEKTAEKSKLEKAVRNLKKQMGMVEAERRRNATFIANLFKIARCLQQVRNLEAKMDYLTGRRRRRRNSRKIRKKKQDLKTFVEEFLLEAAKLREGIPRLSRPITVGFPCLKMFDKDQQAYAINLKKKVSRYYAASDCIPKDSSVQVH